MYFDNELALWIGSSIEDLLGGKFIFLLCTSSMLGVGYSFFGAVRDEMIFEVVDEQYNGLAIGTMCTCLNIGVMIYSSLIEFCIQEPTDRSYFNILLSYFGGLIIALVFTIFCIVKNFNKDCCLIYSKKYLDHLKNAQKTHSEQISTKNNFTASHKNKKYKMKIKERKIKTCIAF